MTNMDLKAVGKRIRFQREYLNLTREALAEKLNVSARFCADIEYGMKGMSLITLNNLSEVLALSTDYILKGVGNLSADQEQNRDIIESVVAELNNCDRDQLRRVEQLLESFAVEGETAGK